VTAAIQCHLVGSGVRAAFAGSATNRRRGRSIRVEGMPTVNQRQAPDAPPGTGRQDVHGDDLLSVQVLRRIEADIVTGRLKPGSRLAPERELGARLGVARNTLRRALSTLGERGLIQARGRGGWVVVAPNVTERIEGPPSLTEWAARHGYVVTSNVIAARVRPVKSGEAADLRIPTSSKIFELDRVRFIEGVPISFDRSVLHPRLIPVLRGLDFASRSLFGTIRERAGLIATRAEVVVHAVPADERAASLLTIEAGEPLLELDEMTFDQYDEPFETARLLNRGDRYAFATTLTAGVGSPRVAL
jgi:GntR family transcriptional regulator